MLKAALGRGAFHAQVDPAVDIRAARAAQCFCLVGRRLRHVAPNAAAALVSHGEDIHAGYERYRINSSALGERARVSVGAPAPITRTCGGELGGAGGLIVPALMEPCRPFMGQRLD